MSDVRQRVAYGVLVLAAVFLSHTLAYLVAHPDSLRRLLALAGHGYFDLLGAVIAPASVVTVAAIAVRHARAVPAAHLTWRRLAGVQALAFASLEIVERIPLGTVGSVVLEPAVAVGLFLQVPIAYLFVRIIGTAAEIIRRVDARRRTVPAPQAPSDDGWHVIVTLVPHRATYRFSSGWRGPPTPSVSV